MVTLTSKTAPFDGDEFEMEDTGGEVLRQTIRILGALPAGEDHLGSIGNNLTVASANFTRPADTTAYASGDLVANNVTAGSVTPLSFTAARVNDYLVKILRARIKKSAVSLTNAQFRLHLYRNSPTLANGDNAAWSSTESGYLGYIAITVDQAFSDAAKGVGVPSAGDAIIALPTSGAKTVFGLLEARAAYTPASAEVFTVELEVEQA